MKRHQRLGFTLVELLVVIAIVGVLVGLLMPAIQQAREAARRISCSNNLHQLGVALQNHEAAQRHLPSSWRPGKLTTDGWSAQAQLLPYLEQNQLYTNIDFERAYGGQTIDNHGIAVSLPAVRVPVLLCPSTLRDEARKDSSGKAIHYPTSYGVNCGTWLVYDPVTGEGGDGAFVPGRKGLGFRDMSDGLSSTLAMAEVNGFNDYYRNASMPGEVARPTADSICNYSGSFKKETGHTEWVDGRCHQSGFTALFPPNQTFRCSSIAPNPIQFDWTNMQEGVSSSVRTYAAITSRSRHPGGVQVLFLDGHTTFVTNHIRSDVWHAIATRAMSEVVEVDLD